MADQDRATRRLIRDYGLTILIAVAAAVGIRVYVLEAYRIPTPTMRPTLEAGDTIFVAKWPFAVSSRAPARGEVIVYTATTDDGRRTDSVKRVLALGGETFAIKSGRVRLNGQELAAATPGTQVCGTETIPGGPAHGACWEPPAMEDVEEQKIPADQALVVADLRSQPATSSAKTWAVVPLKLIKGKAMWIWLSIEPRAEGGWFPRIRFDRMLRRIE